MNRDNDNGLCSQEANRAIGNQFDLVLAAANRVRDIRDGRHSTITSRNGDVVHALMEIERGLIGREYVYRVPRNTQHRRSHHRSSQ
jgi:DNA-directed RNA polymerase omega subunit